MNNKKYTASLLMIGILTFNAYSIGEVYAVDAKPKTEKLVDVAETVSHDTNTYIINGRVYKTGCFKPVNLTKDEGRKLVIEWEGPFPCYPLEVNAINDGIITEVTPIYRTKQEKQSTRNQAKMTTDLLLIEEEYWEEFQMLQKYKIIHPNIAWTDIPVSMRYSPFQWETVLQSLPALPHPDSVSEGNPTELPRNSLSERNIKRNSSSSGSSLTSMLTILLLSFPDTDLDGLPDWWEIKFYDPVSLYGPSSDPDVDGLTNLQECQAGSFPLDWDTDDDGLSDSQEVLTHGTLPYEVDTDDDGLSDHYEVNSPGLSPTNSDTDNDGVKDGLDIYPTTPNHYAEFTVTQTLYFAASGVGPNSGTRILKAQFNWNPSLPSSAAYVKSMKIISGEIDDAAIIGNLQIGWEMERFYVTTPIDVTSVMTTSTGTLPVLLYDWCNWPFPDNACYISNKIAITYVAVYSGAISLDSIDLSVAPGDGLIIQKGATVTMKVNSTPTAYMPPSNEPKWFFQQLNSDGSWTTWSSFGPSAVGMEYTHSATISGIFRVKAVLQTSSENLEKIYERKTLEPFGSGQIGDPDSFGVVDSVWQMDVRNQAKSLLGDTSYALAANKPPFGPGDWKCNLFVADMCNAVGVSVPWINGAWPLTSYPPTANQWADPTIDIGDWAILSTSTKPQPGEIVAFPRVDNSGHVGILDYDGRGIAAGQINVNKEFNFLGLGTARFRKYEE